MNKHPFFLTLIASLILAFGCDKIDEPVLEGNGPDPTAGLLEWDLCPDVIPSEYVFPTFAPMDNTTKNILLEDYTGHTCTNCPAAAVVATNLEEQYPEQLIVMSVHAMPGNGFQAVQPGYTTDFTTPAGDAYVVDTSPECPGNPVGSVNRLPGGWQNTLWHFHSGWPSMVEDLVNNSGPTQANIALDYFHCPEDHGLFLHAAVELETEVSASDYRFILFLIREDVVAPQSYPSGTVEDYHHHHVLSDNINGTWGNAVRLDTMAVDEQVVFSYSYQLPDPAADETFAIDNMAIIGCIIDRGTGEVLQSELFALE